MKLLPPSPLFYIKSMLAKWAISLAFVVAIQASAVESLSLRDTIIVESAEHQDAFALVSDGEATRLVYDDGDWRGVIRAIGDFKDDLERVTGIAPAVSSELSGKGKAVLIGTVGKSAVIDELIAEGKVDGELLDGKWEAFIISTVEDPLPGIDQALVIAGSDKRGTIYGIYELSKQIGVSPWYYWADVPAEAKDALYVKNGTFYSGEPKVKYRGIFLNDESPCLRNWAKEQFGGHNHEFYAKVFELILRNRGNYLWPAMWLPTIFNVDDPENARLADEYGIVMSTSHHEPMMRSHQEWYKEGEGPWNYETNKEKLQEFWRGGIERMGNYESVVTVGMRGDGDEAMAEDTAIDLLKTIISDQRKILSDVLGKPAHEIPQVWALYKEVQDYYDEGMRVDDDILVLFSDDNWGNLRYLPKTEDLGHKGGFGIYYHFDYVGGPVSYRWMNVTQIERVWEQMNLAYEHGVKDLWIVNVGDIKPMELPISFFMDFAWDPEAIDASDLPDYYTHWAAQQFGETYAEAAADVLARYTKYNSRRTPEMLNPELYSVENYREADRILEEFRDLSEKANEIYQSLPEAYRSAFYQLALFPVDACLNLNEMYVAAGKSKFYAERGYAAANHYADVAREHFAKDAELTRYFHEDLEGGKWNHMMSQTHIGYTYWNHPPLNKIPVLSYVHVRDEPDFGFLLEYGKKPHWGWLDVESDWAYSESLPNFDPINDQQYFVEVLNRGEGAVDYSIEPLQDWIQVSPKSGSVELRERVYVSIDWNKAPKGSAKGELEISGSGNTYRVQVPISNVRPEVSGFVENNGVISIEAANYERMNPKGDVMWIEVPNLGRTGSAMTVSPANAESRDSVENSPVLEYRFTTLAAADISIQTYLSPTLNFTKGEGLRFAIAIDDAEPQIVNMHEGEVVPDWKHADWWSKSVAERIKIKTSEHGQITDGVHTLRVWMLDPGVVLQKFVIDAGGLKPSYLGAPESLRVK